VVVVSRSRRRRFSLAALLAVCPVLAAAEEVALTLSSGEGAPGGVVNLELSVSAAGNSLPAALQWTIDYSPDDIAAVEVAAGPVALFADKTVVCNPMPGSIICIAYGLNLHPILDGVVATIQLTLSATANTSTELKLTGGVAADPMGSALPATTAGARVTILQAAGASAPALRIIQPALQSERARHLR